MHIQSGIETRLPLLPLTANRKSIVPSYSVLLYIPPLSAAGHQYGVSNKNDGMRSVAAHGLDIVLESRPTTPSRGNQCCRTHSWVHVRKNGLRLQRVRIEGSDSQASRNKSAHETTNVLGT